MKYISDFHIHSKYSRATSKYLDLEHIELWCKIKGIDIVAVADFTHPVWFKELSEKLTEAEEGLYKIKDSVSKANEITGIGRHISIDRPVRFLFATEISCIYKNKGKVRRNHIVIVVPNMDAAAKVNQKLGEIGNLKADGRPILGLPSKELARIVLEVDPNSLVIPAHIWTPWFSMFGSKSGYDSMEECFDELTEHIYACETGLSSDPPMNWRISELDKVTLVSNSDAHSLQNLGREANVFDMESLSYNSMRDILVKKDKDKFKYTIEFYPEEGKYHMDGCANCSQRLTPEQTAKLGGRCKGCGKIITVGVMSRVNDLADRKEIESDNRVPFMSIVPLAEMLSEVMGRGKNTKTVQNEYFHLIENLGSEFDILTERSLEDIGKYAQQRLVEAIDRMRQGNIVVQGGYDGVYGTVKIFEDNQTEKQKSLF